LPGLDLGTANAVDGAAGEVLGPKFATALHKWLQGAVVAGHVETVSPGLVGQANEPARPFAQRAERAVGVCRVAEHSGLVPQRRRGRAHRCGDLLALGRNALRSRAAAGDHQGKNDREK
jgi:hypothetical protein